MSFYFLIIFYLLVDFSLQNENLMLINFIRHGNRTPGKIFPEIKDLFHKMDEKKLTLSGFKQMNILGKIYRKKYLLSNVIKLDLKNISHEYLIISSPSPRSVESSIAFSMGLLPDTIYKIYDYNNLSHKRDSSPPVRNIYQDEFDYFNLIIEKKNKNTLFHVKKCKFEHKEFSKNKNYSNLTLEERKIIFDYFSEHFSITMKNVKFESFSDKLARSIYSSIRIVNKHYHKKFKIPTNIDIILKRILSHYSYFAKMADDEASKMMSSTFFDHLIKLFDQRISNHKQYYNTPQSFFKSITTSNKSHVDFLPTIENEDYSKLKFVTYSGHDGNIAGIIRNFLSDQQLEEYFRNFNKYKKLVHISFGASVDFVLNYKNGDYYVKILFNGEELFEKIRSYKDNEYLKYDKFDGIRYEEFRKFLESRLYEHLHKCKTQEN